MEPIELEHVIGFGGQHSGMVCNHPQNPDLALIGMGCNVVVQDMQDDHSQRFLQGHDEQVSALTVSQNGTFVASGQEGSRRLAHPEADVFVWDLAQYTDVYRLKGVQGQVTALAFTPDELFLAGAGTDGSLIIWDMQTGEAVTCLKNSFTPSTLLWGPVVNPGSRQAQYSLMATIGPQVKMFKMYFSVASMHYKVEESDFRLPAGMIRDYSHSCLGPGERVMLLATSIGDVNVYQVENLVYRAGFPVCSGGAKSICTAGPYVFVGGGDGSIKRLTGYDDEWGLDRETEVSGAVTSLSVRGRSASHVSQIQLIAGTDTGRMYVIDGDNVRVLREIRSETEGLVAVSFKPSCSIQFATMNHRGTVRVWDLSDYSIVTEARGPSSDRGLSMVFDEYDDEVVTGSDSGAVRAYSALHEKGSRGSDIRWEIAHAHRDGVSAMCATALFYATGGRRGGVRLWSRSSKTQLFEFGDHINKSVISLIPDCRQPHLLHSCGTDRCVFTYDLKKERRMMGHQWDEGGIFTGMTQRVDGENELVTAGTDGRLLVWDFDVPEPVSQVSFEKSISFTSVQVSPTSGKFIAAVAADNRLRIWSLEKGSLVATSPVNGFSELTGVAWSPDEKQIVSVGMDKCICVWNFYVDALTGDASLSVESKLA